MKNVIISLATAMVLLVSFNVQAQQVDEFRIGGTWAQPSWLENSHPEGDQTGIGAELLFTPVNIDVFGLSGPNPSNFMHSFLNPRPHIGAMVNLDDGGTSYVYTGLTWQYEIDPTFFIESSFGFSVNNGKEDSPTGTRAKLGSHYLFHESIGIGANLTETMTVILAVEHLSHANLFGGDNRGLTNMSLRVGHKF
ncbi:MAG: acyloxyacyl hydrolase [Rhizobiaceae bacterium]